MPLNKKAGAKRLVDMSPPLPPWSPELETVEEYTQQIFINDHTSFYVRIELDERRRLNEWAVTQVRDGLRIAAYDVCHGKGYHVHLYNRHEEEFDQVFISAVDGYAEMDASLTDAYDRVSRNFDENERRCDRGR